MVDSKQPPRLYAKWRDEIRPALMERYGLTNGMQVPRVEKIVVSMGVGEAKENKALLDAAMADLTTITGQKAAATQARMSVSNFKLREGMPIGCRVTLRGPRMWEFLDRLVSIAIPRIKDFRGLKRKLDGRGNYSMGLADQTVFPEIDLDKIKGFQGMNVTIVTSAPDDEQAFELLERLGLPFRRATAASTTAA